MYSSRAGNQRPGTVQTMNPFLDRRVKNSYEFELIILSFEETGLRFELK